jgi:anti-anti-sigma factor
MIIEKYDIGMHELEVACGRDELLEIPGYIAGLILIADECRIKKLLIRHDGELPGQVSRIVDTMIERNPWISIAKKEDDEKGADDGLIEAVARKEGFMLLRENDTGREYSMVITADSESTELAARSAYLVANVLGFQGSTAFDVRFGIYEILMNVVDHDAAEDEQSWIQIRIDRKDDRLSVTIIDKGGEFDPTDERDFELDRYVSEGRRRGLGLVLMQRMYESFHYERKNGLNRIFFDRTMPEDKYLSREDKMSSIQVGEYFRLENGVTRIELSGDLDAKGALALEGLMDDLLEKEIHQVALDLKGIKFVSSAGIGMLLGLTSTIRDEGGEVWLTHVSDQVVSVFALLNLDDFFNIKESEEEIVVV